MKYTNCNDLNVIRATLATHRPSLIDRQNFRQAAVALIVRQQRQDSEILFIQRAASARDPWSGQVAFPGGRVEPGDIDLTQTAIRETREETGVALPSEAVLGRLDDLQGRNNNKNIDLIISCLVFQADYDQLLVPNYEVAEAFWIPLSWLSNPSNHFHYDTEYRLEPYPAIHLGTGATGQPRVLWGLTYRFVSSFLDLIAGN